ncbi:MAG: lipid kinase [Nocardioidaceae bacterium]
MAETPKRTALVVNAASRTGAAAFERAQARLGELGVQLSECYPIKDPTRLGEVLDHLADTGVELVIVGGGDGTISTAVDHLARHGTTLGILPLGTANDLARTLQIPTDVDAACDAIAHGKVVDIDIGRMGDNHFLNVASIGLSVGVAKTLTPRLKRRLGPLAYPIATAQAYRRHKPFAAYLEFPDGDHDPVRVDDIVQVAIGNGRHYGGGQTMSPTSGIDDHSLDVYAIRVGGWRDRVWVARRLRDGSFVEHDNVLHLTTRRVRLSADPEQPINLDGEVVASTPQLLEVDRNAIDVLVPQESTAASRDKDVS